MSVALPKKRMSADEFLSWDAAQNDKIRYELVDGHVRFKYAQLEGDKLIGMARDRAGHNRAKSVAWSLLDRNLKAANSACEAYIDGIAVRLNNEAIRIPDVVVDCGEMTDNDSVAIKPVVIVEIVSESSAYRDAHYKYWEYFDIQSVVHYLIIYPEAKRVVHHRRRDDDISTKLVVNGELDLDPIKIVFDIDAFFEGASR